MVIGSLHPHPQTGRLSVLVREFEATVGDPAFPCMFATRELNAGRLLFAHVPGPAPQVDGVVQVVLEAVRAIKRDPLQVVVVFIDTDHLELKEDAALVTQILELLLKIGKSDWPDFVPRDTRNPRWSLWVDGVDLFLNANSPRHLRRRSRNLGSALTLVIQSRATFDELKATSYGVRARIRERLRSYDEVPPHPSLGTYGAEDNREVDQYFLGDGNCPIALLRSGTEPEDPA